MRAKNTYRLRWLLLTVLMAVAMGVSAQMPIKLSVIAPVPPDSADLKLYSEKHPWRAAATVAGLNLGIWSYDRFIEKGDYAYISLHSIKENFKHGFIWDNDKMGTNMFLHPYHGNLYYNAARSNNMNYWRSGLYALGGSAMWELLMEREYPSTNDVIATPVGGMAIGEVCYRVSDAMIDDRLTGWARFEREAGVFLVSPMRGLTRIINGDAWRVRRTSGQQFGTPNVGIEFGLGSRIITFSHKNVNDTKPSAALEFNMEYGDRFEVKSVAPYDYFTIKAALNLMNKQPFLSQLNIKGRLLARELRDDPVTHLSVGLYQHFDYYDSDTTSTTMAKCPYKLGVPASFGAGILYRRTKIGEWAFDAFAHANAVLLGAILSDYYQVDERNYNLAAGYSLKIGANCVLGSDKLSLSVNHEFYRLFTWKGYPQGLPLDKVDYRTLNVMGDKSTASFGVTEVRINMRVWKRLYFSMGLSHYFRTTHYHYYPNVRSGSLSESLMVMWKL